MKTNGRQFGSIDALEEASSVLLLAPSLSDTGCADLLQPTDECGGNMLWVSYTKSPDSQLRRWRARGHGHPANLGIVSVGESTRSTAAAQPGESHASGPIEAVANPNELTGLGIRLNNYLRRWEDNGHQTTICFDSLTAMLQYIDPETAYEFLHILTGRIHTIGARAYFHMDPSAHDERTVERIVSLCDAVVDLTGEERTIRSR